MGRSTLSGLPNLTVLKAIHIIPHVLYGTLSHHTHTGKGEEIYMNYGPHSNDFLLIECKIGSNQSSAVTLCSRWIDGFYLEENESDAVYLDDIIFRDLSPSHREELSLQQYYGYVRSFFHATSASVHPISCTLSVEDQTDISSPNNPRLSIGQPLSILPKSRDTNLSLAPLLSTKWLKSCSFYFLSSSHLWRSENPASSFFFFSSLSLLLRLTCTNTG